MLTASTMPAHDRMLTIEHTVYDPGPEACAAALAIARPFWTDPNEMAEAAETGSIWTARWMAQGEAGLCFHAAAGFDTLAAAIGRQPGIGALVDRLRVAIRDGELDCERKAAALRAVATISALLR